MMKRQSNEKGFAAVEAVLIVIILGLVGFTGWFVWHSKQQTNATLENASKAAQSQAKVSAKPKGASAADPATANWTNYRVKDGVFAVKYPPSWVQPSHQELCGGFLDADLEIGPTDQSVIKCGADGTVSQVSISWTTIAKGGGAGTNLALTGYINYKTGTITIDGVQGKTYSAEASNQGDGLGSLPDGTIVVTETFEKSGKIIIAQYIQYPSTQKEGPTQDQRAVFDQIVSTLKFY